MSDDVMTQDAVLSDPEGASTEQLEGAVPYSDASDASETAPVAEQAPVEEKQEQTQPDFDAKVEIENLKREQGRYRAMQRELEQLKRQLNQPQKSTKPQNELTPEQRLEQMQLQEQQGQLETLLGRMIEAKYGDKISVLDRVAERERQEEMQNQWIELAGEDLGKLTPSINKIWSDVAKDLESPDDAVRAQALSRYQMLETNPARLMWEANRLHSAQVNGQAQSLVQSRTNAGLAAAQSPKGGAPVIASKKSIGEMNQAELDKMPLKELEAAVPYT